MCISVKSDSLKSYAQLHSYSSHVVIDSIFSVLSMNGCSGPKLSVHTDARKSQESMDMHM